MAGMAVGDVGRKIREAREAKRPKMTMSELAQQLGVSHSRLSNWERGQHDPAGEIVAACSRILGQPVAFFYDEAPMVLANQQKNVYYNHGTDDSDPDDKLVDTARLLSDQGTIRVEAFVVDPSSVWDAKGAQRLTLNVFAYLAGGRTLIKLADQGLKAQRGTVLIFQPDDYPQPDVYLLLSNRRQPNMMAIRYIDSQASASDLISDDGSAEVLSLQDWNVEGYAWGEIRNAQSPSAEYFIRPSGIGPRTSRS